MKFHPFADAYQLIEGKAFDDLAADVKAFGLRDKIVLFQGKILDGRNRYLACQKVKVKPLYRTFKGSEMEALAFVESANVQRRHLTEGARALAAARISTLRHGLRSDSSDASRDASTQAEAAEKHGVSRSSVQRARKVVEHGSKALQKAVAHGDVPLRKAASVVDLPKSEQLAAATSQREDAPEMPTDAEIADADAAAEQEYASSIAKVMEADDKLAAAHVEIKRQAAEIASLKLARDGFMNGKTEMTRLLKKEQAKNDRLIRENERLQRELSGRSAA